MTIWACFALCNASPFFIKNQNKMKTIIFDIDGTLTDMWPIERSVLLQMTGGMFGKEIGQIRRMGISETYKIFRKVSGKKMCKSEYAHSYNRSFLGLRKFPKLKIYPIVDWIKGNRSKYRFVYATGGQKLETEYVLAQLGLINDFDLGDSVNKGSCRFSKKTGIPFRKIRARCGDCCLITDSESDFIGAKIAGIPAMIVKPGQKGISYQLDEFLFQK